MKKQANFTKEQEVRFMFTQLEKNLITIQEWWNFIELTNNQALIEKVVMNTSDARNRLKDYKDSFYYQTKIRQYCNQYGYTDVYPYEVVKVISPKCVEIRAMDSKITKAPKEFYPGGFSGHFADNYAQEWECTSNESHPIRRIRLGKKGWGLGRYHMSDTPNKFHDYNF